MPPATFDITRDDLSALQGPDPAFVTFGEVMVRDTPADAERPERTRLVHLSMAGSEYTLAIGLSRLGIESAYITRVPDNPYGRAVRNIAREHGVNTDHIVWAPRTDLIGRMIYEIGRTPRRDVGVYQRKYSAASCLDAGMVDWAGALRGAKLFHTSGITFGLARHSGYDRNYNLEAFKEAVAARPAGCMVGLDFNYRSTLWSAQEARDIMTPLVTEHVDVLVTTIEDMAELYGIGCGQYTAKADQRRRYRSARRRRHPFISPRRSFASSTPVSSPSPSATPIRSSNTAGNRRQPTRVADSSARRPSAPSPCGIVWAGATPGTRASTTAC